MLAMFRPTSTRSPLARRLAVTMLTLSIGATSLGAAVLARAEGQIRIAEQFGVAYLLLNVARDQKLIEKEGRKQGFDINVDWVKLSGGSAVNEALLSGAVNIAGAGVGPLLTIWDRTHGKQNVKGVASLGNLPYYLVTDNTNVKTIADFTDNDRIALPAVNVSVQSRVAVRCGEALGRQGLQPAGQADADGAPSGRDRGDHRGRHGDHWPLRQSAVSGPGAGGQSEGAHRAEFV